MIKKTALAWPIALTVMFAAATASAQHYQPFGDFEAHYDFQPFAPPIIGDYGDDAVHANIGWYGAYSRMLMYVNRPDRAGDFSGFDAPLSTRDFDADETYGNLYEFGYMTEDRHGWNTRIWQMHTPGVFALTPTPGVLLTDSQTNNTDELDVVETTLDGITTLNDVDAASIELNKVFRLKPLEHGGILEPFVGARYMKIENNYIRNNRAFTVVRDETFEQFVPFDIDADGTIGTTPQEIQVFDNVNGTVRTILVDGEGVLLTSRQIERQLVDSDVRGSAENDLIAAQAGFRYYLQKGHWTIAAEVRGFAMHNFASVGARGDIRTTNIQTTRVISVLPPVQEFLDATNFDPQTVIVDRQFDNVRPGTHDSLTDFAIGGELNLNAEYHLTREVSIRFGLEFLMIGRGVIRSPVNPMSTSMADAFQLTMFDEDFTAVGAHLGLMMNR